MGRERVLCFREKSILGRRKSKLKVSEVGGCGKTSAVWLLRREPEGRVEKDSVGEITEDQAT